MEPRHRRAFDFLERNQGGFAAILAVDVLEHFARDESDPVDRVVRDEPQRLTIIDRLELFLGQVRVSRAPATAA